MYSVAIVSPEKSLEPIEKVIFIPIFIPTSVTLTRSMRTVGRSVM